MEQLLYERIDRLLNLSQRWLTITEACLYSKMSKNTLMGTIGSGHVFASKRGGKWIVDRTSIDQYYMCGDDDRLYVDIAKRISK
jgi:hypothetical protein